MTPTVVSPAQGGGGAGIDALQAGLWVPAGAPFVAQTSLGIAASRTYACRFVCPRALTITKIGFCVSALSSANDSCDAGIYSADGSVLLSSSGSTAGKLNAATGIQTLNLQAPVSLLPNTVYYAAWSGGPSISGAQMVGTALFRDMTPAFGATVSLTEQAARDGFHPLVAPFAPIAANGFANVPIMGLQT